ncbi:MAG: AMP-binding protein, partial [Deltaproteobacteria bacterium]|nr:AMP-binding protein [Deltaproteobacteria bacterium]
MPLDLEALGNRWADRPAVIFPSDALSFAGLAERVLACARDLAGHGVSAGDRIGLVCGLDADTVVSILAAQELGCVLLPLGADAPSAARERVLATFRPAWVVEGGEPSAVGSSAVTSGGPEVLALTSSGSTGAPKLALVTASQLRARADLYIRRCRLSSDDRTLMIYPPHHAGGMHALLVSLSVGSALVFPASAHPRTVVRTCAAQGVTCLPGPATLFELLVRHRSNDWPSLPCLRLARSGTANLPLETHRAFTEGFQIPLWHSYGASEAGPICVNRSGAAHDGRLALGAPLAGVEVRVCDEHGDDHVFERERHAGCEHAAERDGERPGQRRDRPGSH